MGCLNWVFQVERAFAGEAIECVCLGPVSTCKTFAEWQTIISQYSKKKEPCAFLLLCGTCPHLGEMEPQCDVCVRGMDAWGAQKEITGEFSGAKAGRKCSDEKLESSIIIFQTGFHFVPLQPVTHHGPTQNLKHGFILISSGFLWTSTS